MSATILTRESFRQGARYLARRDPKIGAWIGKIGPVGLRRQRPYFGALCRTVIAQQLASKAAATIHGRFLELFGPRRHPQPEDVLAAKTPALRSAGLSRQKIDYLRSLAEEFASGGLRGARFSRLSDDEVVERLTVIKGIGVWSAEMFLIFSLGRIDVFSVGDLALRNGVARVEGRALTQKEVLATSERWAPYRSIASLYLWRIAHWKE